jgi:hypothetical protein
MSKSLAPPQTQSSPSRASPESPTPPPPHTVHVQSRVAYATCHCNPVRHHPGPRPFASGCPICDMPLQKLPSNAPRFTSACRICDMPLQIRSSNHTTPAPFASGCPICDMPLQMPPLAPLFPPSLHVPRGNHPNSNLPPWPWILPRITGREPVSCLSPHCATALFRRRTRGFQGFYGFCLYG